MRERKRGSARSLAFIIAETSGDEESQHRQPGMISLIISIERYPIGNEKHSVIVYMASCANIRWHSCHTPAPLNIRLTMHQIASAFVQSSCTLHLASIVRYRKQTALSSSAAIGALLLFPANFLTFFYALPDYPLCQPVTSISMRWTIANNMFEMFVYMFICLFIFEM